MTATSYCFCYSLEVGVTLIGFLHLNAALYFWARASTFEPIYMWFDILIAACYTIRTTYFFLMLNQDGSTASRKDYFEYNKWTASGLAFCGLSLITLKWLEWSHYPTWTIVAWSLIGLFNYYHWFLLKDYAGITGSSFSSNVEIVEPRLKVAAQEDSDNLIVTNKMQ